MFHGACKVKKWKEHGVMGDAWFFVLAGEPIHLN
jgi:hypothetical protein